MVSILHLISNFSRIFSNHLGIVPSAIPTILITDTFIFHRFFSSWARSKYLFIFSLSLIFNLWFARTYHYYHFTPSEFFTLFFPNIWGPFRVHWVWCSKEFSVLSQSPSIWLSFCFLFASCCLLEWQKIQGGKFSLISVFFFFLVN